MSKVSRGSFLFAGVGLAAAFARFAWPFKSVKPKPSAKAKFLTQDGKLVEIDIQHLPPEKRNASKEDVLHWIKKK